MGTLKVFFLTNFYYFVFKEGLQLRGYIAGDHKIARLTEQTPFQPTLAKQVEMVVPRLREGHRLFQGRDQGKIWWCHHVWRRRPEVIQNDNNNEIMSLIFFKWPTRFQLNDSVLIASCACVTDNFPLYLFGITFERSPGCFPNG